MRLPELQDTGNSRDMTAYFCGYNHNIRHSNTKTINGSKTNILEWYDENNLTSDKYPLFAVREKHGTTKYTGLRYNGMIWNNQWIFTVDTGDDTGYALVGGKEVYLDLASDRKKTLINMGAYVLILPDRKYINTAKTDADGNYTDYGSWDETYTLNEITGRTLKISICNLNEVDLVSSGYTIQKATVAPTQSPVKREGTGRELVPGEDFYIDISTSTPVLKMWSTTNDTNGAWEDVGTSYLKIAAKNIGKNIAQYDGVTFYDLVSTDAAENLDKLNGNTYTVYLSYHDDGTISGEEGKNDFIAISCEYSFVYTSESASMTVKREAPELDYVTECGNRLYGCRYCRNEDGTTTNELYASTLGNFKNWKCYGTGTSQDSWAVTVGSPGPWTGAITYQGHPVFFKEDRLYKIYGDYPTEYQTNETACDGVQIGGGRSLQIVNSYLYYKSKRGVMRYDGNYPTLVSYDFGSDKYDDIEYCGPDSRKGLSIEQSYNDGHFTTDYIGPTAGSLDGKYYISLYDGGQWSLFIYDSNYGMWHREEGIRAEQWVAYSDNIYWLECDDDERSCRVYIGDSDNADSDPVSWYAETAAQGIDDPDHKYISRIDLRMSMAMKSRAMIYIQYDSGGDWEHVATVTGTSLRTFSLPVRVRRCDHFRMRIKGTGDVKIFSVTRATERGSDY